MKKTKIKTEVIPVKRLKVYNTFKKEAVQLANLRED